MFEKLKDLRITDRLPVLGILAFSACSIHSVNQLLQGRANNPTPLYTLAAGLIELATAWLVYGVVEQFRTVTKSRISKQDRRFALSILVAFTVLAIPSLATSVVANALEFNDLLLGLLFPGLSVACAVGAALPETVQRHETEKQREKAEAERKRKEREKVKAQAAAEAERVRQEAEAEQERIRQEKEIERTRAEAEAERIRQLEASLGSAAATLRQYLATPQATQAEVAAKTSLSERTVRYHLRHLEALGLIKRNGKGVELTIDLPEGFAGDNGSD